MKVTGAAVLGMAAATQAFHVPLAPRSALSNVRSSSTSLGAGLTSISDAEVRLLCVLCCVILQCNPTGLSTLRLVYAICC